MSQTKCFFNAGFRRGGSVPSAHVWPAWSLKWLRPIPLLTLWVSQVESSNVSRDNVSREIGRMESNPVISLYLGSCLSQN